MVYPTTAEKDFWKPTSLFNRFIGKRQKQNLIAEAKIMSGFNRLSLEGRVAVVTGSSSGIGAASAILMAQRGAKVTLHGRREDKLLEVANQVEAISGEKPFLVIGSIEDDSVRKALIFGTIEHFGRLDILINNAGWTKTGGLENTSVDDFRNLLEVHILAPFELCQMAAPEIIKNKGNIIMTSSICGLRGYPIFVAYSAAKAGMDNMMRSLSGELGPQGVRINCVNPGPIFTDILRNEEEFLKSLTEPGNPPPTPLGRVGSSDEAAELIAFLASDAASMISGNIHTIDGGISALMN